MANIELDRNDRQYSLGIELGSVCATLAFNADRRVQCLIDRENVENVLRIVDGLHRPFRAIRECPEGCHLEFCFEAIDADI